MKPSIRPQSHTQNHQSCERQKKAKKLFPLKPLAGWVFSLLCAKNKWEKQIKKRQLKDNDDETEDPEPEATVAAKDSIRTAGDTCV